MEEQAPAAPENPQKTIHIGGLPNSVTNEELFDLASIYGIVRTVEIPKDKETGLGRGFAYVEFVESADAKEAIVNLDGSVFQGRTIYVSNIRKFD